METNIKDDTIITSEKTEPQSNTQYDEKRIKELMTKHGGWIKTTYKTKPFKEPIMWLARRNGQVSFHENATAGEYHYIHSDGSERFIKLNSQTLLKFGTGDRIYRGYWCHEDSPVPLNTKPGMTSEEVGTLVEKANINLENIKIKRLREERKSKWIWILGVIILAAIAALYFMSKPQTIPTEVVYVAKETGQQVINATIL